MAVVLNYDSVWYWWFLFNPVVLILYLSSNRDGKKESGRRKKMVWLAGVSSSPLKPPPPLSTLRKRMNECNSPVRMTHTHTHLQHTHACRFWEVFYSHPLIAIAEKIKWKPLKSLPLQWANPFMVSWPSHKTWPKECKLVSNVPWTSCIELFDVESLI